MKDLSKLKTDISIKFYALLIKATPYIFKLYSMLYRRIERKQLRIIFLKSYINAFENLPDNKISENIDIALVVKNKLCNFPSPKYADEVKASYASDIEKRIRQNSQAMSSIIDYFRLQSLYYDVINTEHFKEKSIQALENAKKIDPNVIPLRHEDMSSFNKNLKSELIALEKEVKNINIQRIKDEKPNFIEKIKISSNDVLFIASIFTTLFLVSGYLYSSILFKFLGIEVADFFSITDYMAVSVDVLASVAISTFFGFLGYMWGMHEWVENLVHRDQFGIEQTDNPLDNFISVLLFVNTIALVGYTYKTGTVESGLLYPLTLFIAIWIFLKLPLWLYIENHASVSALVLAVLIFGIALGFRIKDDISTIQSKDYSPPYQLVMDNQYKQYANYMFVAQNSRFVFLMEPKSKEFVVLPESSIKSFYANVDN